MMISFRSRLFNSAGDLPEGNYHGEDLANWLRSRLVGWQADVCAEDWGWAISARKMDYAYIFGVYDHDLNDVTANGPMWAIRLFNKKDRSNWFRKLFKYTPPTADEEVTEEILQILKQAGGITEVRAEPLS